MVSNGDRTVTSVINIHTISKHATRRRYLTEDDRRELYWRQRESAIAG